MAAVTICSPADAVAAPFIECGVLVITPVRHCSALDGMCTTGAGSKLAQKPTSCAVSGCSRSALTDARTSIVSLGAREHHAQPTRIAQQVAAPASPAPVCPPAHPPPPQQPLWQQPVPPRPHCAAGGWILQRAAPRPAHQQCHAHRGAQRSTNPRRRALRRCHRKHVASLRRGFVAAAQRVIVGHSLHVVGRRAILHRQRQATHEHATTPTSRRAPPRRRTSAAGSHRADAAAQALPHRGVERANGAPLSGAAVDQPAGVLS